jgi:FHA domain
MSGDKKEKGSAPESEEAAKIARLEKALAEAQARNQSIEAKLADHQARLKSLGTGREETMRALADTRSELQRVSAERDELRTQLSRIDNMQAATIALPDDSPGAETAAQEPLPSIEELMAGLGEMQESTGSTTASGHLHLRVQAAEENSEEMLSPAVVFPEEYATTADAGSAEGGRVTRLLVLLDGEQPIKYPLYKDEMTIGRAESADIRVKSTFISRLHARVRTTTKGVVVEDFESKNGIKVNSTIAQQHVLKHGDVLSLGPLRFRFLDMAAEDG